jgi:gp32 DNA binding protein like
MSTTSFADMKRSRTKDLAKLTAEVTKLNDKGGDKKSYEDTRFWKPAVDKAGNGYAVIRFLPAPAGEDMPWVQVFSHAFQGPTGQWYIENSLTTMNKKDPVSELNTQLWNSGLESDKEIARKQKRKLSYIANVYIVKDPANPENEGSVRLFKFGKKIFDKLNDVMNPEFQDEEPMNPFDLWEGANFKLKIRKYEGYPNYDKSEFDTRGAVSEDEDDIERIWNSEFKLQEFLADKNFKSYDELKARLNLVLNTQGAVSEQPVQRAAPAVQRPAQATSKPKTVESDTPPWKDETDDGDDVSYFAKLAED